MTPFTLRSVPALALAASFTVGLTGCTAAPRYPIEAGQAAGGGFEPLQPRYPVRAQVAIQTALPAVADSTPILVEADPPPRAAPVGDVTTATLVPISGASAPTSILLAQADARPAAAASSSASAPSAGAITLPATTPTASQPASPARGLAATASANSATPFLQSGVGAGPPRFTIGVPVLAAPAVVAPAVPTAPSTEYARPSAPPVYARPIVPAPSYAPRAYAPPVYARPSVPAPYYAPRTYAPPTYARPSVPAPSYAPPTYASPTYARPNSLPPSYARPSTTPETYGSAPTGGPRPYTSLFPQGPRPSRGPIRSAGIRSTPGDPGIAPQPLTLPPVVDASPPSSTEAAALGQGRFVWPLRGAVISGYGDKGGGQRNDGLNIAANIGESVKAAAAGEVVYAGDLVPGSGNLVLVKHPGGWVTAYAHLSRIEVKIRDPISQGQEIGQAGQTGGVDRPQLHFEIRYARNPQLKAAPVDPAVLLPRG